MTKASISLAVVVDLGVGQVLGHRLPLAEDGLNHDAKTESGESFAGNEDQTVNG